MPAGLGSVPLADVAKEHSGSLSRLADFDPLRLRDPKTESVATALELMTDRDAGPYSITILAENLKSAEALAMKLKNLPAVDKTVTLTDFVPKNQREKLDVIATTALFLSPSFAAAGTAPPPTPDDRSRALAAFRGRLDSLAAVPGGGPLGVPGAA